MVHEMFLRSPRPVGVLYFGITVTNSCFQISGHYLVAVISLKIFVSGMASRVAYLSMSTGKMSLLTMDFGFLKALILPSTW